MSDIAVAVGAYASYRPAAKDWDELDLDPAAATCLVDGAIIEWSGDRVGVVHCCLRHHGWGYGALASAVVGALWPPSLLAGAIAGGVGDRVLTFFTRWLPVDATVELGRVLREGRVAVVLVTANAEGPQVAGLLGRHSVEFFMVTLEGTSDDLFEAARDDASGAFET